MIEIVSRQVVFGQTEIVECLTDHLRRGTSLCLQPTLEMLAALATDLQQDFWPHLQPTLSVLMAGPFCIR